MKAETPRYKVYDTVWVMEHGAPKERMVFAVIEYMNYWKTGTDIDYRVVCSRFGAGFGNNPGELYNSKYVYPSKEALIKSL